LGEQFLLALFGTRQRLIECGFALFGLAGGVFIGGYGKTIGLINLQLEEIAKEGE